MWMGEGTLEIGSATLARRESLDFRAKRNMFALKEKTAVHGATNVDAKN